MSGLQLYLIGAKQGESETKFNFKTERLGNHRFVREYLNEVVFENLDHNLKKFLLKISVLHQFNLSLCYQVSQEQQASAYLEEIKSRNLFLIPLDPHENWFRFHHLFSDFLRTKFKSKFPQEYTRAYHQASVWHEEQGLESEAISYALEGADFE